jgi:hypothetical protein
LPLIGQAGVHYLLPLHRTSHGRTSWWALSLTPTEEQFDRHQCGHPSTAKRQAWPLDFLDTASTSNIPTDSTTTILSASSCRCEVELLQDSKDEYERHLRPYGRHLTRLLQPWHPLRRQLFFSFVDINNLAISVFINLDTIADSLVFTYFDAIAATIVAASPTW